MKLRLDIQERRIDELFVSVSKGIADEELISHMAKYLCIRMSGYLENVVRTLIIDFTKRGSPKEINSFVEGRVRYLTNISDEKLATFLKEFSDDWLDKFNEKITDAQREALNSIIANRNAIAHGQTDNTSFLRMKEYFERLKEVVIVLHEIIKK